ncbi:hypothetical protein ZWY2020_034382 [Hordeum vulgare]|nr:hypothetical protein ZWY2020_034382 [Hordeum vulgare]
MERQGDSRRPLPRRGQVMASIFASLFPCLARNRKAAAGGERKEGKVKEGGSGGRRVAPDG